MFHFLRGGEVASRALTMTIFLINFNSSSIFSLPLTGFLILVTFLYSSCVCKCVYGGGSGGVRRLDTFGEANRVVITVKDSVVGTDEDIPQDPERATRGWDVQA